MFELRRHNPSRHMSRGYTDLISRHHTAKAAQKTLKAAELDSPDGPRFFVSKPTTLMTSTGLLTGAYYLISAACHRGGATVTKRAKGFSDYGDLMALVEDGMLEIRHRGPRGGQTWHATRKGRRAIVKVTLKP